MGSCRGVDWSLLLLLVRSVYGDLLSFPICGCWSLGVSDLLLLLVSLGVLRLCELLRCGFCGCESERVCDLSLRGMRWVDALPSRNASVLMFRMSMSE